MSEGRAVPWTRFTSDPRHPDNAPIRASDLDRSVALDVLAQAYGDGRLDREEYDERAGRVQGGKTLGDLVGPLRDLAPVHGQLRSTPAELQQKATEHYRRVRQNALSTFVVPNLICWVIWIWSLVGSHHGLPFPWPLFVTLGTGGNLVRVLTQRQEIVEQEKKRIERRETKAIEKRPR